MGWQSFGAATKHRTGEAAAILKFSAEQRC
jgi:hypothetical protein